MISTKLLHARTAESEQAASARPGYASMLLLLLFICFSNSSFLFPSAFVTSRSCLGWPVHTYCQGCVAGLLALSCSNSFCHSCFNCWANMRRFLRRPRDTSCSRPNSSAASMDSVPSSTKSVRGHDTGFPVDFCGREYLLSSLVSPRPMRCLD